MQSWPSKYFTPTLIARRRKKADFQAIYTLNLLAGWAVVGWIIVPARALTVKKPTGTQGAR
jgi:hypothetical protein